MTFRDRDDAGRQLAAALSAYRGAPDTIVLAIPRGGVAVGAVVAHELRLPLDVIVTKKIGAPDNPEYAIGSVDAQGNYSVDQAVVAGVGMDDAALQQAVGELRTVIQSKERKLRGNRPPLDLTGQQAIVVDDGAATGHTALAAIKSCRALGAKRVIVALPVGPPDSVAALKRQADDVVILSTPASFAAVAQFYDHFDQVSDEEAAALLAAGLDGGAA
jgi:predicted phosphoribosyltransferase